MSIPLVPIFNPARLLDLSIYNDLATIKDRVAFSSMVRDYMVYLRSNPCVQEQWDESLEKELALNFVKIISGSELAWAHARQVIPEFRRSAMENEALTPPLKFIMQSIEPLLAAPPILATEAQRTEEDQLWRRWETHFRYVAYLGGEVRATDLERQKEVTDVLAELVKTVTTVRIYNSSADPPDSIDRTQSLAAQSFDTQTQPGGTTNPVGNEVVQEDLPVPLSKVPERRPRIRAPDHKARRGKPRQPTA